MVDGIAVSPLHHNNTMTLTPAYGRTYKRQFDIIADFNLGKDFIHQPSGQLINNEQIPVGQHITLRYGKDFSKVVGYINPPRSK